MTRLLEEVHGLSQVRSHEPRRQSPWSLIPCNKNNLAERPDLSRSCGNTLTRFKYGMKVVILR